MDGLEDRGRDLGGAFGQPPAFMNKPDIPLNRRAPPMGARNIA
jgi:hypothetical protein